MFKKNSKNIFDNPSVVCILFLMFFVAPCVLHETLISATLVKPIWLLIYAGITFLLFAMRILKGIPRLVTIYCFVVTICAFLTIGNGTSIGMILIKVIYIYIGFVGFMLIKNKEMSLWPFDIAMVVLYCFFYQVYYRLLFSGQLMDLGDAFENSSSNAISISMITVLFLYYLLNIYYKKNRDIIITLFSFVNIVFIFFQGSRAGLIVSVTQFLLCLYGMYQKASNKALRMTVVGGVAVIAVALVTYSTIILDSYDTRGFEMLLESRDDDARVSLMKAAFARMDTTRFLLGFSSGERVDYDHRTYNAFIDYWLRYGLLPFIMLIAFSLRRIFKRKKYSIPVYVFIPLFLYTFGESYLTYGPWQYLLLATLFLGEWTKVEKVHINRDNNEYLSNSRLRTL